ncbi:protein translocase subunit SecF, partial [Candidatus Peribacteria bacterium]|nr:protein translocase subunit SecF [Candidatus Peribacteria bacterium]
ESIKWFVLTLITGATIGTYSSIFLATPLLVYWRKRNV